jgi:APA family basic amino acid/polyamine antiporter
MRIISPNELVYSNEPFANAAKKLFGSISGLIIAGDGVVICSGALDIWMHLQDQIPKADFPDNFFSNFSRVSFL